MTVLKYIGKRPYEDPDHRFVAVTGDSVEFVEIEAAQLLATQPKEWEAVKSNGGTER